jgi:hypothetical protein
MRNQMIAKTATILRQTALCHRLAIASPTPARAAPAHSPTARGSGLPKASTAFASRYTPTPTIAPPAIPMTALSIHRGVTARVRSTTTSAMAIA